MQNGVKVAEIVTTEVQEEMEKRETQRIFTNLHMKCISITRKRAKHKTTGSHCSTIAGFGEKQVGLCHFNWIKLRR